MNPYAILFKLAPYAIIVALGLGCWALWERAENARHAEQEARQQAEVAQAKLDASQARQRELDAMLATRELDRIKDQRTIAAQHKRISEYTHEGCLHLDDSGEWLDRLLSGGPALPPSP